MDNQWLETLKPGDTVIRSVSGMGRHSTVEVVERLTKTQIILKGISIKYRRKNGWSIGGSQWNTSALVEATPERIERVTGEQERRRLLGALQKVDWQKVSTQELEEHAEILARYNGAKGSADV